MKEGIKAMAAVVVVIVVFVGVIVFGQQRAQSAHAPAPLCSANVVSHHVHIHCELAGLVILDTDLPISIPTVTLPPVTLPTSPPVTIRLPGPTVRVPGPTATVTKTLSGSMGPTATHTVTIKPRQSVGPGIPAGSKSVGQTKTSRATITASPKVRNHTKVETHTKTDTIVHRVFLGTLVAIGLILLAILALMAGYYFGYKDAEKSDENFMQSLIQRVRGERKH